MKKKLQGLILCFSIFIFVNATFIEGNKTKPQINNLVHADSTIKIDSTTGLKIAEGLDLVTAHCTGCHSSKLIVQFGSDKKGWLEKIRWMQQKQKLWDLGEAEPVILNYLANNYPAKIKLNRRNNLRIDTWYKLTEKK
jgi:hypothetical protein